MTKNHSKKIVLSLIKDDLKKWKLIYALQSVGFINHDFDLHIFESILDIMGIERSDTVLDELTPRYLNLVGKVREIDIRFGTNEMEELAEEIYGVLGSAAQS